MKGREKEDGGGLGLHVQSSRAKLDELNDERLSDGASAALGALVCAKKGAAGEMTTLKYVTPDGTPSYMPPEVVRYREYSDKSDVWALGLTILECLTGAKGYPYSNAQTTLFQVGMGATPHVPAWLGREARNAICACLEPNPGDRPTAAALLSHPFLSRAGRGAMGGVGGVGGPPPSGVRAAEVPTALLQLLASLNSHVNVEVEHTSAEKVQCCARESEWGQVGAGSNWRVGGGEGEKVSDFATPVRARKATKATIEELEEGGDLEKDAMRAEQ